jgi:multidrug efflux pump subunit AcrA (membrane-fusion protein)
VSRFKWPVAVLAAVLVLATGRYAVAQTRESETSYRTATAKVGDVERTLDLSGTVMAAGRRDLSFGAAGKVSKVAVHAGQRVSSGQVLARLDPTSFDAAVTAAVATLAKARAQLASDEDAQSSAVTASAASTATPAPKPSTSSSSSSSSGSGSETPATPTASTPDPAAQKLLTQIGAQQRAVTEAQTAASAAITAAKTALASQADACTTDSSPSEPASPSASPSAGAPDDSGSDDSSDDSGVSAACTDALAVVQAAQDTVEQRQDTLRAALTALGKTLGQAVRASSTPASGSGSSHNQSSQNQSSQNQTSQNQTSQNQTSQSSGSQSPEAQSSSGQSSSGQSSSGSVTAARLAQDQADVDTAQARLLEARAERRAATLRAPYAGRILRSDLAKGDLVAASDPAFVLVGSGATTVTTTVTTVQVPSVRRGQRVTVTPAGWTTSLTGTVSAIGLLADSDGAFPVTVTVASTRTVAEGSTASVAIVTGSVKDAVTVPVSALTTDGERTTVQVLSGDTVTRTSVTAGVLGTRRAAITRGLKPGARVVLADLDAAVPSSTMNTNQRARFNGAGGAGLGATSFRGPGG